MIKKLAFKLMLAGVMISAAILPVKGETVEADFTGEKYTFVADGLKGNKKGYTYYLLALYLQVFNHEPTALALGDAKVGEGLRGQCHVRSPFLLQQEEQEPRILIVTLKAYDTLHQYKRGRKAAEENSSAIKETLLTMNKHFLRYNKSLVNIQIDDDVVTIWPREQEQ